MPRSYQALFFHVCFVLTSLNACKDTQDSSKKQIKDDSDQGSESSCDFGDDNKKCEGRDNLLCSPLTIESAIETASKCDGHDECARGQLCLDSPEGVSATCKSIEGQCLFHCAGNFDCANDEYCNPESGACQKDKIIGDRFGSACDKQKDCAGTCITIDDDLSECEETCRVGATSGCGHESLRGSGVSCAFFAYDLVLPQYAQGMGDVGICAHLCDSNADCPDDQLCLDAPTDGHAGICAGGLDLSETVSEPNGVSGGGGAGGAGNPGGAKN